MKPRSDLFRCGDRADRRLRLGRWLVIGAMLGSMSSGALAQIFSATDADGCLVLSNHATSPDAIVLIGDPAPSLPAAIVPPAALPGAAPPDRPTSMTSAAAETPKALRAILRDAAQRHSIPTGLLTAMVAVESGFDTRAVSAKGAKGLMQLMPDTARRFGVKDVFAAEQNIRGGAAYLRVLMNLFPEDLQLALAAYNAGEAAVLRAGRRIPAFPETQLYVRKVLTRLALSSDVESTTRR